MRTPPRDDLPGLLGRLYDEHAAGLYRYALMVLADHAGAEDAVQDAFASVAALRRVPETPAAYLRTAVRNACYTRLRRHRRWTPSEQPLLEVADASPEDISERLALEDALRTLSAEQREVVHLHVFEGRTLREIAEMTGTSINTTASRYRYALGHMRGVLTAAHDEGGPMARPRRESKP